MALLHICANLYHVRLNREQLGSREAKPAFEVLRYHTSCRSEHYTENQKIFYLRVEKQVMSTLAGQ